MPNYGKDRRLYVGQGTHVVDVASADGPALGGFTLDNEATVQSLPLSGQALTRHYPIRASVGLTFDRILIEGTANVDRLVDFFTQFTAVSRAQLGELVADFAQGGCDGVVWFRDLFRNSVSVAHPFDDLASVNGAIGSEEPWPGTVGALATLSDSALVPATAAERTYSPVDGQGGFVLLTDTREGSAALALETKRGAAAWTAESAADAALASTVSTAKSAVSLDAIIPNLAAGDRVRVRFPTGTAAGNSWTGRLAFCAPISLD